MVAAVTQEGLARVGRVLPKDQYARQDKRPPPAAPVRTSAAPTPGHLSVSWRCRVMSVSIWRPWKCREHAP